MKVFARKFAHDWSTNLAAMLAYHLIVTAFPILLAVLSVAGMLLHAYRSTHLKYDLAVAVNHVLPAALHNVIDVNNLLDHLIQLTGPLAMVSLLGLLLAGSGLFSSMENAFSIVFRTAGRDFVHQKVMAGGMVLVFAALLSVSLAACFAAVSAHAVAGVLPRQGGLVLNVVGLLTALGLLWLLFLLLYRVVPPLTVPLRSARRGALVAAVLVALLNLLFPAVFTLLRASDLRYGAVAATALVMVVWLWLLALITMVGAQITALDMGVTPAQYDVAHTLALNDNQHVCSSRHVCSPPAQPAQRAGRRHPGPRRAVCHGVRADTVLCHPRHLCHNRHTTQRKGRDHGATTTVRHAR